MNILVCAMNIQFAVAVTVVGHRTNYGASINCNGLLTLSELLSLTSLLRMTTSFIKENHFNNCI